MGIKVNTKIYKGKGCSNCNYTGYFGRVAIFEMLKLTREIKRGILEGVKEDALREICIRQGFSSLRDAALKKVFEGITTVEEFLGKTLD
jgi:type IV pilus assembly protein PilB